MSMFPGVPATIEEYVVNGTGRKQKKQNPEYLHLYQEKTREHQIKRCRTYYAKNRDRLLKNQKLAEHRKLMENPDYYRDLYRKNRKEVLDAYGGKCTCCGETHYEFLAIDHINNDGKQHRLEMKGDSPHDGSGDNIIRYLRRNKFPPGFQILCHNCNQAKGFYGQCPHQKAT